MDHSDDGGDTRANVGEPIDGDSGSSRSSFCYEIPNPSLVIPVYFDVSSDSEMTNGDLDDDPEEDVESDGDDVSKDPEFTPETYKVSHDKWSNVNS